LSKAPWSKSKYKRPDLSEIDKSEIAALERLDQNCCPCIGNHPENSRKNNEKQNRDKAKVGLNFS
jgi:hypothetical protein